MLRVPICSHSSVGGVGGVGFQYAPIVVCGVGFQCSHSGVGSNVPIVVWGVWYGVYIWFLPGLNLYKRD